MSQPLKIKQALTNLLQQIKRFFLRFWHGRHVLSDLMKHKHRFVVLDTDTYKEKLSFQLSGANVFVFLGITSLVLIFITALLLAFTPLRELIPGYSNPAMVRQTYENAHIIDSLEIQLKAQEDMLADIQNILQEKDPTKIHNTSKSSDTVKAKPSPYTHSKSDTLLRQEVEGRKDKAEKN